MSSDEDGREPAASGPVPSDPVPSDPVPFGCGAREGCSGCAWGEPSPEAHEQDASTDARPAPSAPAEQAEPSDLDALLGQPGFSGDRLEADLGSVASFLPLLNRVTAVTATSASMMSETGGYGDPSFSGGVLSVTPGLLSVRVHPSRVRTMVVADGAPRMPPSLQLFDGVGASAHRAYVTRDDDRMVLDTLRLGLAPELIGSGASLDGLIVQPGLDPALAPWQRTDHLSLVDGILADGGVSRRAELPALGSLTARQVSPWLLAELFAYLSEHRLPITLGIGNRGCVQFHAGPVDDVDHSRGVLMMRAGACAIAVDPVAVAECWVTRVSGARGPTSVLELYDAQRRCVGVVTQLGAVAEQAFLDWEDLASSLP